MGKFYVQDYTGHLVSFYSKNVIEGAGHFDTIKVREDLVEVFSDMDLWEKNRLRIDYFDLFRKRSHEEKEQSDLLSEVLSQNYEKQVDILSELFFEVLYIDDFRLFVTYIESDQAILKFFEIIETYELDRINNFHEAVLKTIGYFNRIEYEAYEKKFPRW